MKMFNDSHLEVKKSVSYTHLDVYKRQVFTTTKDMDEIVLRFGQAGRLCLSGARYAGKYIDWTHASLSLIHI